MDQKKITLDEVIRRIKALDGTPFRIEFVKRTTEEIRVMNATTRAPQHAIAALSGKGKSFDAAARGLLTVWDLDKQEWRHISTEGIRRFMIGEQWVPVQREEGSE